MQSKGVTGIISIYAYGQWQHILCIPKLGHESFLTNNITHNYSPNELKLVHSGELNTLLDKKHQLNYITYIDAQY